MPASGAKKGEASGSGSPAISKAKKRKQDSTVQKYYAVRVGVKPGVYMTWDECVANTEGYPKAYYKAFLSEKDAHLFVRGEKTSIDETGPAKFYAVATGNAPGIYTHWDECFTLAIKGSKKPKFKKFTTRKEAVEYIWTHGDEAAHAVLQQEQEDAGPALKKSKKSTEKPTAAEVHAASDGPDVVHVFTDGSSRSNGRVGATAGVGVFFGPDDERNVSERLQGELQTNQRAELTAILRALQKVPVDQDIRIFSDSQYSIKCVAEWYKRWEQNGWKTDKGPVKNKDLVEAIRAVIDEREELGTNTYFRWIKGHADDPGNIAADELAVRGAMLKK